MKWVFLLGNIAFALACFVAALFDHGSAGYLVPIGALSAFMAFVIWNDCRGEWTIGRQP